MTDHMLVVIDRKIKQMRTKLASETRPSQKDIDSYERLCEWRDNYSIPIEKNPINAISDIVQSNRRKHFVIVRR